MDENESFKYYLECKKATEDFKNEKKEIEQKKDIEKVYCYFCNKHISKKNIAKHYKTEKHKLREEIKKI